jgi:hypothetical protein
MSLFEYNYEEWNIGGCWINKQDQCSYVLKSKTPEFATFSRDNGQVELILSSGDAIRFMSQT